jgi:hypothetical protein
MHPSRQSSKVERVLVCILSATRAHELCFSSFKRHVLDELNADLAVALTISTQYDYENPFWQHAKYRWTAPEFDDIGQGFDLAQRWICSERDLPPQDWRALLAVKGIWQGRIQSPEPQLTASSIQTFCRWLLLHGLRQDGVLDRYDRFVLTRSDFFWLSSHPPLDILDQDMIWVPEEQDYGGLNDRHLVASRQNIGNCLGVLEEILLHPLELYREMKHKQWNNEQFFAHHLKRCGLSDRIRRFPYVMYMARSVRDRSPTWSRGKYEPTAGHYVKYSGEYRIARAFATVIRDRADWERGSWRSFDPDGFQEPQVSIFSRLLKGAQCFYFNYIVRLPSVVQPGGAALIGRKLRQLFKQNVLYRRRVSVG